jgi:predicted SnoaL-like aldol condensation-catalyzing enzyme
MTDIDPAEENKRRFLDAFGRFAAGEIEVLREIIREDFVSHTVGAPPGRDAWIEFIVNSPIDIWRFEDGLIVEHWDVSRPVA